MKLRKWICGILSVITAGSAGVYSLPVQAAAHPNLLIGDANRDGVVDIHDVTEIQRCLAELTSFDDMTAQVAKADFSKEALGISDATVIQKHLAEMDEPAAREVGHAAFIWKSRQYVPAAQEYQRYLDQIMTGYDVSGVACVTRNGRVLCQAAAGKANTAENRDITPDTLFPVGSVAKQFCAAVILKLQEQGKLSVSDKLTKYFPAYTIAEEVTLHHMLCMRSGIRDYLNQDDAYAGHELPAAELALSADNTEAENEAVIRSWLFSQALKFTPGKSYAYSNSNFLLLADIAEMVTGKDYGELVKEFIYKPLGMTASGIYGEMLDAPEVAESYLDIAPDTDPDLLFRMLWLLHHTKGDGDVVTNAADMDKWMTSLREGTVLSKESLAAMTVNYGSNYGYGIGVLNSGVLAHLGDIPTYEAAMWTNPAENLNVFIVTNNVEAVYAKNANLSVLADRLASKVA